MNNGFVCVCVYGWPQGNHLRTIFNSKDEAPVCDVGRIEIMRERAGI